MKVKFQTRAGPTPIATSRPFPAEGYRKSPRCFFCKSTKQLFYTLYTDSGFFLEFKYNVLIIYIGYIRLSILFSGEKIPSNIPLLSFLASLTKQILTFNERTLNLFLH